MRLYARDRLTEAKHCCRGDLEIIMERSNKVNYEGSSIPVPEILGIFSVGKWFSIRVNLHSRDIEKV